MTDVETAGELAQLCDPDDLLALLALLVPNAVIEAARQLLPMHTWERAMVELNGGG